MMSNQVVRIFVAWSVSPAGWLLATPYSLLPDSGGSLELIHPGFVVLTVIVSTFVLAGARKRGWAWYAVALWTAGAVMWPQLAVPGYVAWRLWRERPAQPVARRYLVPLGYLTVALGCLGVWLYREYHTVEAHLARAQQYRVMNRHEQAADELRGALEQENNPHTHNLLGQEFMTLRRWREALGEFQTAVAGGEPDPLLSFRMGEAWRQLNRPDEARVEYQRFYLASCQSSDEFTEPCAAARQHLANKIASGQS